MCCLEGRHFLRDQGYSLIIVMVNPALIVPLTNMAHATVKLSIAGNFYTVDGSFFADVGSFYSVLKVSPQFFQFLFRFHFWIVGVYFIINCSRRVTISNSCHTLYICIELCIVST